MFCESSGGVFSWIVRVNGGKVPFSRRGNFLKSDNSRRNLKQTRAAPGFSAICCILFGLATRPCWLLSTPAKQELENVVVGLNVRCHT